MAKYLVLGDLHGHSEYLDEILHLVDKVDGVLSVGDIGGYATGYGQLKCYVIMMNLQKRLIKEGRVCIIARGNHEDGLEWKLDSPEVSLTRLGISRAADMGHVLFIKQLFGNEVCKRDERGKLSLDGNKIREVLVDKWRDELRKGNREIIRRGCSISGGRERLELIKDVLYFTANLPEEESVGRVKLRHTIIVDGFPKYVVDENRLNYFKGIKKKSSDSSYLLAADVFKSDIFNDCDVLILGHVHNSDTYHDGGKRILIANSPFTRTGEGIIGPVLIYEGGLVQRRVLEHDFSGIEAKIQRENPDFLGQIELYKPKVEVKNDG